MVKQYPHTIVLSVVPNSSQDSGGDWVNAAPTTSEITGRYEPNLSNRMIPGPDGQTITFGGIIYAPIGTPEVDLGTDVDVKSGAQTIATGKVKMFTKGQLNVRILI